MSTHTVSVDAPLRTPSGLRPATWAESLALFGVPALALCLAFYGLRPWLEVQGYSPIVAYLAALCVPMALMFASALIAYHRIEGLPLTIEAFATRMRYPRPTWRDLVWALVIFVVGMLGYGLMSQIGLMLVKSGALPLPANLPILADPLAPFSLTALDAAAGGSIKGQWGVVVLFIVTFFFNIAGEELWWRGYILPRQELVFGRHTWWIHGLLWAAFHMFKYWDVLGLLPICLLISFAAQRTRRNWASLIAHALFNVGGVVLVTLAVIG